MKVPRGNHPKPMLVPGSPGGSGGLPSTATPPPAYLAMAAAHMDSIGKLTPPQPANPLGSNATS